MQQVNQITLDNSGLSKADDFSIDPIQQQIPEILVKQDYSLQQLEVNTSHKQWNERNERAYQHNISSNFSDLQTDNSASQQTRGQEKNASNSYYDESNIIFSSEENDNSTIYNEYQQQASDNLKLVKEYLTTNDPFAINNGTEENSTKRVKLQGKNINMLTNPINNNDNLRNSNKYSVYERKLLQLVNNLIINNRENEIIFQVAITFSNINFFLDHTTKNLISSQRNYQKINTNNDYKKQQNYYCLCGKFYQSTKEMTTSLYNHLKLKHYQNLKQNNNQYNSYLQIYKPFSFYLGITSSLDKYFNYFESYITTLLKSQLFQYYFYKNVVGLDFIEQLLQDILNGEQIIKQYFSELQLNLENIMPPSINDQNNSLNNPELKRKQQIIYSQNEEFEQVKKKTKTEEQDSFNSMKQNIYQPSQLYTFEGNNKSTDLDIAPRQDEPKYTIIDKTIRIKQLNKNKCNIFAQSICQKKIIPRYIMTDKGILQFNSSDFYNVSRFGKENKVEWSLDQNKQKIKRNKQVLLEALEQFGKKKPLLSALAAIHLANNPSFVWDSYYTNQSQLGIMNDVFYLFQQYLPYDKTSGFRVQRFEFEDIEDMKKVINDYSPAYKEKLLVPLYFGKKGDNYLEIIDQLKINSNQKLVVLKWIDQAHWESDIFYQDKHFSSNLNLEEARSEMIDVEQMQFSIFLWQDGEYEDKVKRKIEQDIYRYLNLIPDCVQFLLPQRFSSDTLYITQNISDWLNQICDESTSGLCSGLANCINLQNLSLELIGNQIGDKGASGLGSGLANCINLSNLALDLSYNQIGDKGASGLGSGLANCINLSNLTLGLSSNKIGDEGASGLGSGLANCINLSNFTLELRSNKIGDEGASGLGSGLANCINLSNLTLDFKKKQFICFEL
ncbi:hypothetical protein TTHERM_00799220 (macronuclear) [Tetrahymena thermophila SB210]|uniref:Uncharacterized protein n=1 Tax=Tetrahymena thermophila (strain SB210) TaxID=312017 RepID=Q23UA3_TETTS|nr:hypothetical protein TTHERM_00799220 [Tetrahymena thermophila SB210]EAS00162.3 hypothetical protein TTHERM_00799220 [Tetrahymena thermophila SB210]|eukprot:XP_001020407.3 hypothetical protein TTHERM_00799220 [Tetrahymena thermophila SB210]